MSFFTEFEMPCNILLKVKGCVNIMCNSVCCRGGTSPVTAVGSIPKSIQWIPFLKLGAPAKSDVLPLAPSRSPAGSCQEKMSLERSLMKGLLCEFVFRTGREFGKLTRVS